MIPCVIIKDDMISMLQRLESETGVHCYDIDAAAKVLTNMLNELNNRYYFLERLDGDSVALCTRQINYDRATIVLGYRYDESWVEYYLYARLCVMAREYYESNGKKFIPGA